MLLTPPGVDEARLSRTADRTNVVIDTYAAAARSRFEAAGGVVVDGRTLIADLGPAAYDDDGLHLTGAAYEVLLPALADVIGSSTRLPRGRAPRGGRPSPRGPRPGP